MRIRRNTLIAVLTFVLTTGLMVALVGATFSRLRLDPSYTYRAQFEEASGLTGSSDVRGAGVRIGTVKSVELVKGGRDGVVVTFSVDRDITVTAGTEARIRYANLTGDRYLDLTPGAGSASEPLVEGATIPVSRTRPALDLDSFLQGFDPLMQAISPDEVNELASNLLAVTQGQAGAVATMLHNIGSFTNDLASRDKLIGDVVTNLSQTLGLVANDRGGFDDLITELARLMKGLAADRTAIVRSLGDVAGMANDIADLLERNRPAIKANADQLGAMAGNLNSESAYLNWALGVSAVQVNKVARLGAYGSFFNFYLCKLRVEVTDGRSLHINTPTFSSREKRCHTPPPNVPGKER